MTQIIERGLEGISSYLLRGVLSPRQIGTLWVVVNTVIGIALIILAATNVWHLPPYGVGLMTTGGIMYLLPNSLIAYYLVKSRPTHDHSPVSVSDFSVQGVKRADEVLTTIFNYITENENKWISLKVIVRFDKGSYSQALWQKNGNNWQNLNQEVVQITRDVTRMARQCLEEFARSGKQAPITFLIFAKTVKSNLETYYFNLSEKTDDAVISVPVQASCRCEQKNIAIVLRDAGMDADFLGPHIDAQGNFILKRL